MNGHIQKPSISDYVELFRGYPAGVTVITADAGEGPVAMTATSLFSVSADPPLFGFSVSAKSSSAVTICSARTIVVHFLTVDDLSLAQLCSTSHVDRFSGSEPWRRLPTGEVRYLNVERWLRAEIISRTPAKTATIVLARATEWTREAGPIAAPPLVYHRREWHSIGGESRAAQ